MRAKTNYYLLPCVVQSEDMKPYRPHGNFLPDALNLNTASSQIHSALHSNTMTLDISRWSNACQLTVSNIGPNLVAKCLERRRESSVTIVTWLKLHGRGTGIRLQKSIRVFFTAFWTALVLINRTIQRLLGTLTPIIKTPKWIYFKRFSTINIKKHNFNKLR